MPGPESVECQEENLAADKRRLTPMCKRNSLTFVAEKIRIHL